MKYTHIIALALIRVQNVSSLCGELDSPKLQKLIKEYSIWDEINVQNPSEQIKEFGEVHIQFVTDELEKLKKVKTKNLNNEGCKQYLKHLETHTENCNTFLSRHFDSTGIQKKNVFFVQHKRNERILRTVKNKVDRATTMATPVPSETYTSTAPNTTSAQERSLFETFYQAVLELYSSLF